MENTQETVNDIETISVQKTSEDDSSLDEDETESFSDDQYCENCLRKQSEYLIRNYGDQYKIEFTNRRSDEIKKRKKFRRIVASNTYTGSFCLCRQCDNFLAPESDDIVARSSENVWPAFIYSTLSDENVISSYKSKVWQLIPKLWRYWWVDNLTLFECAYNDITIDYPESIIVDRSLENMEWLADIGSQKLPHISSACNKYMMPCVLCPWGCSEFNFSCGHIPLDIMFQRFLPKTNITLIENIDHMKFVNYCRDDYIRFDGNYDCWLLNKDDWTVKPSVCYVEGKGMQFMVCKEHHQGNRLVYIHPLRQPHHILPCKYSDQICHAVIKPRTITQKKAQIYSNSFQMHEQRGNFNGIDTCNIT